MKTKTTQNLLTATPPPVRLQLKPFKQVALTLVGCGGTGSHLMSGLATLALALRERDIRTDLIFVDPDRVEEKNVGRQLFTRAEIGKPKAQVLAERVLSAYGLPVTPGVERFTGVTLWEVPETLNLLVGAVDNPAAREVMATLVRTFKGQLWVIDSGNENHSGQVFIGNTALAKDMKHSIALGMTDRLPSPYLVCPDLLKSPRRKRTGVRDPSCAELTATGEQSLTVNRMMAAWTCSILHDFLITRDLRYFGVFIDLQFGGVRNYLIDLPTIAEAAGLHAGELAMR